MHYFRGFCTTSLYEGNISKSFKIANLRLLFSLTFLSYGHYADIGTHDIYDTDADCWVFCRESEYCYRCRTRWSHRHEWAQRRYMYGEYRVSRCRWVAYRLSELRWDHCACRMYGSEYLWTPESHDMMDAADRLEQRGHIYRISGYRTPLWGTRYLYLSIRSHNQDTGLGFFEPY